jgi:YVTN family beta-propeller protein
MSNPGGTTARTVLVVLVALLSVSSTAFLLSGGHASAPGRPGPSAGAPLRAPAYAPSASPTDFGGVVASISVGSGPYGIAYDDAHDHIYVANDYSDNVTVINGSTNTVLRSIAVGGHPIAVAYDSAKDYVYVVNSGNGSGAGNLTVVNATNYGIVTNVTVGQGASAIAYDGAQGLLFITNAQANTVSVVSDTTNAVVQTLSVGTSPTGVAYDSHNGYVYVANAGTRTSSSNVTVINGATDSVVGTVSVGVQPNGVAFDASNDFVYVTNVGISGTFGLGSVSVINDSTDAVVATTQTGVFPMEIAVDSSNGFVYVSNVGTNDTTVIQAPKAALNNRAVGSVELGMEPLGIVFDSANGYVYAADAGSNAVSVFSPSAATYPVTFVPHGLPSGEGWYATIGATYNSTYGNPIGFLVPNGTYSYMVHVWPDGTLATPGSGTITVAGKAIVVNVTVTLSYSVWFNETGLAKYTAWTVWINSTHYTTNTPSLMVLLPNGTYFWGIPGVSGYNCDPCNGSFTVHGGPVNRSVTFTTVVVLPPFSFQFTEFGLPNGTSWTMVVNQTNAKTSANGIRNTTTNRVMLIYVYAGTYSYSAIPPTGYTCSNCTGSWTFTGPGSGGVGIPIGFSALSPRPTYTLSFNETGLPSGTNWSVLLGATTKSSTTSQITFREPNGTYGYWIGNVSGYTASPWNGSIMVHGAATGAAITFSSSSSGSGLKVLSFAITPASLPVGTPAAFQVVTSGGVGPLHFRYTGLPAGCTSVDSASWSCTPSASGSSVVAVQVTDSTGASVSASAPMVVTGKLPAVSPNRPLAADLSTDGVGIGVLAVLLVAAALAVRSRARTGARRGPGSDTPYRSTARRVRDSAPPGNRPAPPTGPTEPDESDPLSGLV